MIWVSYRARIRYARNRSRHQYVTVSSNLISYFILIDWVKSIPIDWDSYENPNQYIIGIAKCGLSLVDFRDRYIYPRKKLLFLSRLASCGILFKMANYVGAEFYKAAESLYFFHCIWFYVFHLF